MKGKRFLKLTSLTLALVMLTQTLLLPTAAADSADTNMPWIKLNFKYADSETNDNKEVIDSTGTFYYNDVVFTSPSHIYDPKLATMTLCMAMSAFGSNEVYVKGKIDYTRQSKNLKTFFDSTGFTGFQVNEWYNKAPTANSIACGAAYKMIGDTPLIAVAVRGSNYRSEWASNFTIGETSDHYGFNEAADNVISFLQGYVSSNAALRGKNAKLWITGFSRAAATANLTAAKIDRKPDLIGATVGFDDLYAYTFETPMGNYKIGKGSDNTNYNNIFNLVNLNDLVPKVAPSAFSFGHYGVDKILPSAYTNVDYAAQKAEMLKFFTSIGTNDAYKIDNFFSYRWTDWIGSIPVWAKEDRGTVPAQGIYLDKTFDVFSDDIFVTRDTYVNGPDKLQTSIGNMCEFLFGMDDNMGQTDQYKLLGYVFVGLGKNIFKLIESVYNRDEAKLSSLVSDALRYALKQLNLKNYDKEKLAKAAKGMSVLLYRLLEKDDIYVFSLIMNIKSIGQGHYPTLLWPWLMAMDSNYGGKLDSGKVFSAGEYRLIKAYNCNKVTITLKKKTGETLVYDSDTPEASGISFPIRTDPYRGIFTAAVPVDADCTISITTGHKFGGTPSYTVTEINPTIVRGAKRQVATKLEKDKSYTGAIPAFTEAERTAGIPDGSAYDYRLTLTGGGVVAPYFDKKMPELNSLYHKVNVAVTGSDYGAATGGGMFVQGQTAALRAYPKDGGKFDGWFISGSQISAEHYHDYLIDASWTGNQTVNIEARFSESNAPVNVEARNSGDADGDKDITISWDIPDGITDIASYRVYRYEALGVASVITTINDPTTMYYVDTSGAAGTEYGYYVSYVTTSGVESQPSNHAYVQCGQYREYVTENGTVSGWFAKVPGSVSITKTARDADCNKHFYVPDDHGYITSYDVVPLGECEPAEGTELSVSLRLADCDTGDDVAVQHDRDVSSRDGDVEFLFSTVINSQATVYTDGLSPFFVTSVDSGDAIDAHPSLVDFGTARVGYSQPDARSVSVTNVGKSTLTLCAPYCGGEDFTIQAGGFAGAMSPGESRSFTVQPKQGLPIGVYNSYVEIYDDLGRVSTLVPVEFSVIDQQTLTTPYAEPAGGIYSAKQTVALKHAASDTDLRIYYTTDGTTPTESSKLYTAPIEISSNTMLNAFAAKTGMKNSEVLTELYFFSQPRAAAPVASPAGGGYKDSVTVSLTSADNADIYFTTDGAKPTKSSEKYAEPLTFTKTTTLKAMAAKDGLNNSSVITEKYYINETPQPTPPPTPGPDPTPVPAPSQPSIDLSDMKVVVTPSIAAKALKEASTGISRIYSQNAALVVEVKEGAVAISGLFDANLLSLANINELVFDFGKARVAVPASELKNGVDFTIELTGDKDDFTLSCSDANAAFDIVLELKENPRGAKLQRLVDGVWQTVELKTKLSKSGETYLLRIAGVTPGEYRLEP